MFKRRELYASIVIDLVTINLAYVCYYVIRVQSGWIRFAIEPEFFLPMAAVCGYWLILFGVFGLYRPWYEQSRLDEVVTLVRATVIGILILFFLIVLDDAATGSRANARPVIVLYWTALTVLVGAGRLAARTVQRRLLIAGIGLRTTIIVGRSKKANDLCEMVLKYPALGYRVVGFIRTEAGGRGKRDHHKGIPILGWLFRTKDKKDDTTELLIFVTPRILKM